MTERRQSGRAHDLPEVDHVSAIVHDTWYRQMFARGITSRPSVDGHEQMVDWDDLPEIGRDLDRELVRTVYRAIVLAWRGERYEQLARRDEDTALPEKVRWR